MDRKYQIFISSTYEDLKEERSKVVETILRENHFPIGMEMFNADNIEQWEQIKRTIDTSDYYILIIKRRYGSLTKEKISFTEKEYDYAKNKKIPIIAFIASEDAYIPARFMEKDVSKIIKLNDFIKKVKKDYPCDFWNNTDELCRMVSQSLHNQFMTNVRAGWKRSDCFDDSIQIRDINKDLIIDKQKKLMYELLRRESDVKLSYEFVDDVTEKLLYNIERQTYIDDFHRKIIVDVSKPVASVQISTSIDYINVKDGVRYYSTNPRFETETQAASYRHEVFSINNEDMLSQIKYSIKKDLSKQLPYEISNDIPLKYGEKITVFHKVSYEIVPEKFFQVYQLMFPCRNFTVDVFVQDPSVDYSVKTATFSSFNVHTYEKYKTEYRKDVISTIKISKWALPGTGYTVVLQRNTK